jgi:hypothetical protein
MLWYKQCSDCSLCIVKCVSLKIHCNLCWPFENSTVSYELCSEKIESRWNNEILPSFPSALQLRVSFGLLNNLPPFFSISSFEIMKYMWTNWDVFVLWLIASTLLYTKRLNAQHVLCKKCIQFSHNEDTVSVSPSACFISETTARFHQVLCWKLN